MAKKPTRTTTHRFRDETLLLIEEMSVRTETTKSEVIRSAVEAMAARMFPDLRREILVRSVEALVDAGFTPEEIASRVAES